MKNFVSVFTASVARKLLAEGYVIADIKPDHQDPDGKRSIFIFKNANGLEERIAKLSK